jgi:hypothetical protein
LNNTCTKNIHYYDVHQQNASVISLFKMRYDNSSIDRIDQRILNDDDDRSIDRFQVVALFSKENDRIKLLVLLCGEEDELLIKAASGTLAVLSTLQVDIDEIKDADLNDDERKRFNDLIDQNRILCEKILRVS